MLDRLPPAWRHLVLLCVVAPCVAAAGTTIAAVLAASGIGVDWATTGRAALDAAAVAAATGLGTWLTSWATPLQRRYGVGCNNSEELPWP